MEFTETEDRSTLRKFARDVAERELAPRATHWDETEEFPQASWDALKAAGLFGVTVSENYGGMGMGDVEAAIVLEELARADVSSAILAQLIFNGPPRAIEHLGNEALKQRWLPLAASGEGLFCIGITEPDAGSAANLMRSHLTDDGSGGFRLNAYKNYVTGGHKAAACLVWTRFPGGDGAKGVGAAQGALEYAIRYMNDRVIGGRPLADLQGLQWKIADMATQLDGARLLLYRAVAMAGSHGTPPALETAMAKTAANLAAKFVCDEAIQLLGGYGYSREYPVERAYRDIRGLCIGAGTVEVQRNYIGTNLLRGRTPAGGAWRNPLL